MKRLLLILLLSALAFGQIPKAFQDNQTISTSGNSITITNPYGGTISSFYVTFTGGPASVNVVIKGCMRSDVACNDGDTLDTYTTVANSIRKPTQTGVYDFYLVTGSWTGGTNSTIVVRTTTSTSRGGGGGGGATAVGTLNQIQATDGAGNLIASAGTADASGNFIGANGQFNNGITAGTAGSNGGFLSMPGGTLSQSPAASTYILQADQAAHCLKYSPDGGAFTCLPTSGGSGVSRQAVRCDGTATSSVNIFFGGIGGHTAACTATSRTGGMQVTSVGTLQNFYLNAGTAGVSGDKLLLQVTNTNGTRLVQTTCTVGTGTTCNDTTHQWGVNPGDIISGGVVTGAADTLANLDLGFEISSATTTNPAIGVTVTPTPNSGVAGTSSAVSTSLTNDFGSQGVSWSAPSCGSKSGDTITSTTWDTTACSAGAQTIVATSIADNSKTGTGTFTVSTLVARSGSAITNNGASGTAIKSSAFTTSGAESVVAVILLRDDSNQTLTAPAGYSCDINSSGIGTHYTFGICWAVNVAASGSTTFDMTGIMPAAAQDWALIVQKYVGVLASPFDNKKLGATLGVNAFTTSGGTPFTTAQNNELLAGAVMVVSGAAQTYTPAAGWNHDTFKALPSSGAQVELADQFTNATGSYDYSGTVTTNTTVRAAFIALKTN